MNSARVSAAGWCTTVVVLSLASAAGARENLSGAWREQYSELIVSVEQWSPACGQTPQSSGRRDRRLTYTVTDRGFDVKFSSDKASFSTTDCQTSNPNVQPKERTVKDTLFLISCSTAEDAPAYENGLYSFRITSPERIEYKETSRFSRNAEGSLCVHTRRVRRAYSRIREQVAAAKPVPEAPTAAPAPQPAAADPCARPGSPASISMEPSGAEVVGGQELCLEIMATDANGCEVPVELRWASNANMTDVELNPKGCLRVAANAAPGPRTLRLVAAGLDADLDLVVVRRAAPERPATGPRPVARTGPAPTEPEPPVDPQPPAEPEPALEPSPEPPSEPLATEPVASPPDAGLDSPVATANPSSIPAPTDESEGLPSWAPIAAVAGGLTLIVAFVVVLLLVRRRPTTGGEPQLEPDSLDSQARSAEDLERSFGLDLAKDTPAEATPTAPPETTPQALAFCNNCGSQLPAGAKFCPYCSHKLL